MSSHLSRGKLNIGLVQEQAKKELLDLLDKCDGSKVIVWDNVLSGPFGLVAEYSILKKRDAVKMHILRPGKLNTIDTDNVIFITRPCLDLMNCVAQNIHGDESSRKKKKWHIFFVPTKSLLCEEFLKNKGVYGSLTSVEQISSCIIFPFDNDVMSMEMESAFKEYYVDGIPTCLYQVALAVSMLEDLFGPIRRVSGKGNAADYVKNLLKKMKKEPPKSFLKLHTNSQIDQLVLIDRSIDYLSALATQLTYSGLVDELFGINNCTVKLPADKFSDGKDFRVNDPLPDKQLILNSSDEIFSEICDKNFFTIGQSLSRRAKHISSQYDETGQTVQEMKQFVTKLPQILAIKKSLANHTTIAEMIKEVTDSEAFIESIKNEHEILLGMVTDRIHPFIEDCMAHKVNILKVLRLICIQSVVSGGLKPRLLEQYKRDIIQTYGFQHILTLTNLEKVGLLKVQQGNRPFAVLRKTLKLIIEESKIATPKDINFVHGVYAPLTVRLVQQFVKPNGIRSLNDVLPLLPGSWFDQSVNLPNSRFLSQRRGSMSSQSESPKVILVFFIGGCTYSEISALRFLSQQEESNVEFVIATTKIINGNTFIDSLVEHVS